MIYDKTNITKTHKQKWNRIPYLWLCFHFVICNLAHFIFLFLLEHDMVIAANVLRQSVYTLLQNPIYRITIIMTNCFVIIIVISWVVVSETNSTLEESQTDDMDDDVDDL